MNTFVRNARLPADTLKTANELAWLLRLGRRHLASLPGARVCSDCGHVFVVQSANSPLRCWKCGFAGGATSETPPADAPGDECPEHGPIIDGDCDKCEAHYV